MFRVFIIPEIFLLGKLSKMAISLEVSGDHPLSLVCT